MKRSIWKGRYHKLEDIKNIEVLKRTRIVEPRMINKSYSVHNGNNYKTIKITRDHVGHKIGEFFSSKKVSVFKKK
jgi:ribosomal protein S19